jgi:hypothetical protein
MNLSLVWSDLLPNDFQVIDHPEVISSIAEAKQSDTTVILGNMKRRSLHRTESIRLVQALYLPPATGIMRMPATRIPLGFKASAICDDSRFNAMETAKDYENPAYTRIVMEAHVGRIHAKSVTLLRFRY